MIRFEKRAIGERQSSAFEREVRVRFQDVDAAGIVFFARFFDYVHDVYEAFLEEIGLPLPAAISEKKWAAPLRHAEADYLAPARFGDTLRVALVLAHLEESEMTLGWRVTSSERADRPCAIVQTVHTFVRPSDFERIELPLEISMKLQSVVLTQS